MIAFDYIYYRVRRFYELIGDDTPHMVAWMVVAILQGGFLVSLDVGLEIALGVELKVLFPWHTVAGKAVLTLLFVLSWLRYRDKARQERFRKKWDDQPLGLRLLLGALIWVSVVGSIAFPVAYGIWKHN